MGFSVLLKILVKAHLHLKRPQKKELIFIWLREARMQRQRIN